MARPRPMTVSAINVRLHPHTPQKYLELFDDAFHLRRSCSVRGDQHMMLMSVMPMEEGGSPLLGIRGEIARFTRISVDGKWFNTKKLKPAEDSDKRRLSIPVELQPNFTEFRYIFFPEKHLFVFQVDVDGKHVSQSMVKAFLEKLFSSQAIKEKYKSIEMTIVPSIESIDEIFRIHRISRLYLTFHRPNADDLEDEERELLATMDSQGIGETRLEYRSARGGSGIKPSEKTKTLARISALNGRVEAVGKNESGRRVTESTVAHPLAVVDSYNPNQVGEWEFFQVLARRVLGLLRNRR